MESDVRLIAEFVSGLAGLKDFLLALGLMLMFCHGVSSGQRFGAIRNGY
jgi:hypothetical protein